MKALALYIDKWYIVGAICIDGVTRLVNLPNREDRIWLYFFEDVNSDSISYGKGYKSSYFNNESHYYGDVFAKISSSNAKFTMFKHSQPLSSIFKMSKLFDDLRSDFGATDLEEIPTFLSFATEITADARLIFRRELEDSKFKIEESVARIEHLSLESAVKKNNFLDEGYYLVLNACNENLHYSIYKKSGKFFLRISENVLIGMGTDLRSRCLIEYIVDRINSSETFLQTKEEREVEYLRTTQYVDDWLVRLSTARPAIPVQITGITLSKDPYKEFSVPVKKQTIDQRTEVIVKSLVSEVAKFVKESDVRHDQINGVVFLGNAFTNQQFKTELLSHYNLPPNKIVCFLDQDLSSLVGSYLFIDRCQFSQESKAALISGEDELRRKKIAEEEAEAERKALEERNRIDAINREYAEIDRKFNDAMEKGYDSERDHEYDDMEDYFRIALSLRSDDEEAKQKYNDALRLKAEQSVRMKNYSEKIQQAKSAFDDKDWDTAKQKAEEALSANPDSKEAQRIKSESLKIIKNSKEFERYIDRADLFIVQKAYKEALQELDKAKLLDIDYSAVQKREDKIRKEQSETLKQIELYKTKISESIAENDFDTAISFCNKLIDLDIINKNKWSLRISEIHASQEAFRQKERRLLRLIQDIDSAQWNEKWDTVVSLCKEALDIQDSDEFKDKLRKAEAKLKAVQDKKMFDDTIASINEMIVRAEFREADAKLRELQSRSLDLNEQQKIKSTRALLFQREAESEKAKQSTKVIFEDFPQRSSKRTVVGGFVNPSKHSQRHAKEDEDDFFEIPAKQMRPCTKPQKSQEDFFDESNLSNNQSSKRIVTNNDFDF